MSIKYTLLSLMSNMWVTSKKRTINIDELTVVDIQDGSILANFSTSGNVFELHKNGNIWYFRICKDVVKKADFIHELINDFEFLLPQFDLTTVKLRLKSPQNRKLFFNMGAINDKSSGVYRCFVQSDPSIVGLDGCDFQDVLYFIHYSWSELLSFKFNRRGGRHMLYSQNRSMCQYALYKLLGIEHMICIESLVLLKGKRSTIVSIMENAGGINPLEIDYLERKRLLSPFIIRDLTTMNIMDVICHEHDHRPGNYNLIIGNNGKADSIKAFDNDSPSSFLPTIGIKAGLSGTSPLIKSGYINRAHVDREFADKLLSISNKEIVAVSKDYLNPLQIAALLFRFNRIKNSMRRTILSNPDFLVNKWGEKELDDDISFGGTYYSVLLNWNESNKDSVLLNQQRVKKIQVVM